MKSSDVVARQTKQSAMDQKRIPVDAKLTTRNAESASAAVDWRKTTIHKTRGEVESNPVYGKDALAVYDRRKRLHKLLDRALSAVGYTQDMYEVKSLHDMLDEAMDSGELADSEPIEISEDEEKITRSDSGRRRFSGDSRSASSTSYVCDSDFISKFLPPNMLCVEAEHALQDRVFAEQADNAMRGYWSGLFYFLRSQPEGSRIRDCKQVTLSTLVSKTLAA